MNGDSIKYTKINQREWDKIAEAGCEWTKKGTGYEIKNFKKIPGPNLKEKLQ